MIPRAASRRAVTLVEIAIAMALLIVGLAAITSTYLTALRWAREARNQFTAYHCAEQVLYDARTITSGRHDLSGAGFTNDSTTAEGWAMGYYVVRTIDEIITLPAPLEPEHVVTVEIFAGGDKDNGELVATVTSHVR